MNTLIINLMFIFFCINSFAGKAILQEDISSKQDNELKLLQEKTLATDEGKTLILSTGAGEVNIVTGTTNDVSVKIYGNENAKSSYTFNVYTSDKGVKVDGIKTSGSEISISIKYDITVPVNYNVDINTGGGEISVNAIKGSSKVTTSGGKIVIDKTTGNIDASTMGGKILITDNTGNIDASTSGGKIDVTNFNGNVSVSTQGGSLNLTGSNGSVKAYTSGGSIDLDYSGVNKGVDISTMAGSIKVFLPTDFNADADVSTMVGKIKCDFAEPQKSMTSAYVKANFNNGGEPFKCSTMAGSITITKK